MRCLYGIIVLAVTGAMLAGCGGETSSSATSQSGSVPIATAGVYTSAVLVTGYENALPANSQLALGTLRLEGTDTAVTPAQAKTLLPLWQAIQNGVLQNDAETNAVLRQIEGTMTAEQLAAIAAMQLTAEDMTAYMQESGLQNPGEMGSPPGAGAMATPPAGGAQGGPGGFGNLSAEEQAAMRATAEAGGFGPGSSSGGPGFGNMTEEQRAAMRATAEASGMTFPGQQGRTGQGELTMLAARLVDLLTQWAAG
jgi:hypothetical protein